MVEAFTATLLTVGPILYALGVAVLLDFATGVWAAWKSGTLNKEFLPTFFNSHVVKKVAPILSGLLAGVAVAGVSLALAAPILAVSGTAATAYLLATIGSIVDNINEGREGIKGVPTSVALESGGGVVTTNLLLTEDYTRPEKATEDSDLL